MVSGDSVARHALVTLLAAAAWLLPCAARAAPGCNIGDILNDGGNALSAVASPACDASYATGVGITAVAAITAALEIISASGGGGTVNSVCNDLNTVKDDAGAIGDWLTTANVSSQTVDDIVAGSLHPGWAAASFVHPASRPAAIAADARPGRRPRPAAPIGDLFASR
jgi:hypothetical protein